MFLVDSSLLKNLNNSSSNSKLNNHVNFSIGKPANEIQYKTIDRIPWREDQKTASTISSTIFDTPQSNRNETFQTNVNIMNTYDFHFMLNFFFGKGTTQYYITYDIIFKIKL